MTQTAIEATPSSASFGKLKAKLWELFELDKADLDFGIYRILRARHKEIAEFLDKHLEKTVREALQAHGSLYQSQVEDDLRKAEQAAKDAGFNPEQSPRVLEIREKLKSGNDLDALADEVYSHLYTFFSRYYQEGDFLGLQRSTVRGREKYMIPYNGEEVKLVWANMDQYYIKSSELLRDYVFQITPSTGTLLEAAATERYTVHFKLVEADTEKDNRKSSGKTTRVFTLDDESSFVEDAADTLTIRFRYREHTAERNLQDKLNADTEKTLFDKLPANWKVVLFLPDPTYQGKDKKDTRTILQKHLRSYTAKHQFDYFIHKDLGGFLRRELDFYIKNEVMYLDDIEDMGAPKAEEYLSKIRAIRRCALPIIQMLEQLENFQKKLWLKKKFVVETRYCITLDRVPETLYSEIVANTAQREEWVKLYAIDEIKKDLTQPGYSEPLTVEFLKANPYLMPDTRHFNRDFTFRLLASVENLDETLDGVCFHSENFQALQLMHERYRGQVKCVYIDPPYNTSENAFLYKNLYKHSSWVSLIVDRLGVSRPLVSSDGTLSCAIDDTESGNLRHTLDTVFGQDNYLTTISVEVNPAGQNIRPNVPARSHDYFHTYAYQGEEAMLQLRELTEDERAQFKLIDKKGPYLWDNLRRRGGNSRPEDRPNQWFPLYASLKLNRVSLEAFESAEEIWPIDPKGGRRIWRVNPAGAKREIAAGEIGVIEKAGRIEIVKKTRMPEGKKPKTHWAGSRYSATTHGTKLLIDIVGTAKFSYPKSLYLVQDCIAYWCDESGTVLDYFGGSGTTGHAVINLNREDDGTRRYMLVEMGAYFDTVLVPRLKKVVYSTDWKDGKPQNRNTGISHAFKIVRLEGYEDTLNNLRLKRTSEQEAALRSAPEKARDQYLLGYFLDVESAGSASLLDFDQFRDPFAYQLKIATSSAGETVDTTIDLVETFNWLLGLRVKHIDSQKGFLTVTGEKRAGGRTLVIWRTLSDNLIADNKALEGFLGKIKINPADTEFDYLYINGSHTLTDPHNKVHLIEEAFQRLMFDTPDFGMES
nr:DNA methyltransferase [Nitrosomonas nitrosa]